MNKLLIIGIIGAALLVSCENKALQESKELKIELETQKQEYKMKTDECDRLEERIDVLKGQWERASALGSNDLSEKLHTELYATMDDYKHCMD